MGKVELSSFLSDYKEKYLNISKVLSWLISSEDNYSIEYSVTRFSILLVTLIEYSVKKKHLHKYIFQSMMKPRSNKSCLSIYLKFCAKRMLFSDSEYSANI